MNEFLPAECPLHDSTNGCRDERLFFGFVGTGQQMPDQLGECLDAVMPDGHAPGCVFIKEGFRGGKVKAVSFGMPEADLI